MKNLLCIIAVTSLLFLIGCDFSSDPQTDYQVFLTAINEKDLVELRSFLEPSGSISDEEIEEFVSKVNKTFGAMNAVSNEEANEYHNKLFYSNEEIAYITNDIDASLFDKYFFRCKDNMLGSIHFHRDTENIKALDSLRSLSETNPFSFDEEKYQKLFFKTCAIKINKFSVYGN